MSDLPPGWAWTTIHEIASTSLGKMLDKKRATGLHPTPYLRNINVRWGGFDLDDVASMDIRPEELDRVLARRGDVIVCEGGEPGRAAVWPGPEPIALQKALHRVVPTNAVSPAYLMYLLWHLAESGGLERLFTGTTIKHLPQEKLRVVPVPLAPRAEQERIVAALEEHLSRLDDAKRSLGRAVQRVTALRLKLGQDVLTAAPEVELGSLAIDVRYGTSEKCTTDGAGSPVIRIPNIIDGSLDLADLKFTREPSALPATLMLQDGDLLFVRTNGSRDLIGRAAVATDPEGLAFASYLIRFRFGDDVDPHYVCLAVSSPMKRRELESMAATTAGQYNLSIGKLNSVRIPLPAIDVQRAIVRAHAESREKVDRLDAAVRDASRKLASLRRAILAAAFAGLLVPQDPEEEPASTLLGRIRDEGVQTASRRMKNRQAVVV